MVKRNSSQEVKIDWIYLADQYKNLGERGMADELLKELVYYSSKNTEVISLRKLYLHHLSQLCVFKEKTSAKSTA